MNNTRKRNREDYKKYKKAYSELTKLIEEAREVYKCSQNIEKLYTLRDKLFDAIERYASILKSFENNEVYYNNINELYEQLQRFPAYIDEIIEEEENDLAHNLFDRI